MYTIDMNKPGHIYFIGIGGISMSGLALILKDRGFSVSGSDRSPSEQTSLLENEGVRVFFGQKAGNLTETIQSEGRPDAVVYTAAVHPDNPEYAEAVRQGIPMFTRAELLGQMMKAYRLPVAVAGTHGKTTTTSMLSAILLAAGTDPTLTIGGVLPQIHSNVRIGHSDLFVTEACEYTNSFLSFSPGIGIILNIEEDHLDFFRDLDDIRNSFRRFAMLLPEHGALVINDSIESASDLTQDLRCRIIYFSADEKPSQNTPYYPSDISVGDGDPACGVIPDACSFKLHTPHGSVNVRLGVPGRHNVGNAVAAAAAAYTLLEDMDTETVDRAVVRGLEGFHGAQRRFERKGEVNGFTVIDDYAHHPAEIRMSLTTARQILDLSGNDTARLWVVFQPHTYSRTKAFLDDFADALTMADEVIMADIYAARETDDLGVSSSLLSDLICAKGGHSIYLPTFEKIKEYLLQNCTKGDLLITMGAGDVVKISDDLTSA